MELTGNFLTELKEVRELAKRFSDPVIPEYQKRLEERGWECFRNFGFSPWAEEIDSIFSGITPTGNTLREKMRKKMQEVKELDL